jgi:glucosamine--fructose-6-phosphate aminotransferase (isomerizing)
VLVLVPNDAAGPSVASLAADLADRGARVIAAGSKVRGAINLPTVPGLHPAVAPVACVLSVYRMVAALSIARGLDPDLPPLLHKVTETR